MDEKKYCGTDSFPLAKPQVLDIRSYSRISKMVRHGLLRAYELPETERLRVRQSEILALIQQNDRQNENSEED